MGLLDAVDKKNYAEVKRLVEAGADVNQKDEAGCTVLHHVLKHWNEEIFFS